MLFLPWHVAVSLHDTFFINYIIESPATIVGHVDMIRGVEERRINRPKQVIIWRTFLGYAIICRQI